MQIISLNKTYVEYWMPYKQSKVKTLISIEDEHWLTDYKWYPIFHKEINNYYLQASSKEYLHRMILDCPDKMQVDHINHNTLDNRISNLRIVTPKENMLNRIKTHKKLSNEIIKDILLSEQSNRTLAAQYGVSDVNIQYIKTGRISSHLYPEIPRRTPCKNKKETIK